MGPRQAAGETLAGSPLPSGLEVAPFPTSSPASCLGGGFYQLPDKEGLGVTNVWAGNSILEACVKTREGTVAKVWGSIDEEANDVPSKCDT